MIPIDPNNQLIADGKFYILNDKEGYIGLTLGDIIYGANDKLLQESFYLIIKAYTKYFMSWDAPRLEEYFINQFMPRGYPLYGVETIGKLVIKINPNKIVLIFNRISGDDSYYEHNQQEMAP